MPVIEQKVEIWKNVSGGLRYYTGLDPMGRETTKLVQAGRTFSVSPLERQLNQQAVADPKFDLFTNGNFILIEEAAETIPEEVESPNSLSDSEIEQLVAQAKAGDSVPLEAAIERATSVMTAQRILEEMVLNDCVPSLTDLAKAKVEQLIDKPTVPTNPIAGFDLPGAPTRSGMAVGKK